MPAAFPIRWQIDWRLDSARQRLAVALAVSIVLHGLIYTGWRVAPAVTTFFKEVLAPLTPKKFAELKPEPKAAEPPPLREVPNVFVEVDPAHAAPEPPKETKNYSTVNSIAANPEPKKLDTPKVDGTQKHVVSVVEPVKQQPKPLEPKPEPISPDKTEEHNAEPPPKPKPAPPPGDLAMSRPEPKALEMTPEREGEKTPSPAVPPRTRPRTLAEARARNSTPEKVQQDGGVQRHDHLAMLDARGSVFGEYDAAFIEIVRTRWYNLLDEQKYMLDRRGKVTLAFRIYYDGRISEPTILENNVGDMLSLFCLKALLDPAPYPKWPPEMRRQIKLESDRESREVKFSFYYE